MKINVDGSHEQASGCGGAGIFMRDSNGQVAVAACQYFPHCSEALEAELLALREGIRLGLQWTLRPLIVESGDRLQCGNSHYPGKYWQQIEVRFHYSGCPGVALRRKGDNNQEDEDSEKPEQSLPYRRCFEVLKNLPERTIQVIAFFALGGADPPLWHAVAHGIASRQRKYPHPQLSYGVFYLEQPLK
uniref:RNase H type-1 domain-containing protein n=1 Tax=Leersia perrieri TaxID=77586 RepID=A0A0D9VUT4_9ORYZ